LGRRWWMPCYSRKNLPRLVCLHLPLGACSGVLGQRGRTLAGEEAS
jgi:hypothetical protein